VGFRLGNGCGIFLLIIRLAIQSVLMSPMAYDTEPGAGITLASRMNEEVSLEKELSFCCLYPGSKSSTSHVRVGRGGHRA
jgi:hypothetical protein